MEPIDEDVARLRGARESRLAHTLGLILDPRVMVAVDLVAVTLSSVAGTYEAVWILTIALCGSVLIPTVLLRRARACGRVSDAQVVRRSQRGPIYIATLLSVLTTLGLLAALRAPLALGALLLAMLCGLGLCAVTNRWTKVSLHSAVASGSWVVLLSTWVPLGLGWTVVVVLASWARVREGRHSLGQVVLGMALGALGGLVFPVLL